MRVLVTGSSGYIGSSLVPILIEHGHHVSLCDIGWFGTHEFGDYSNKQIEDFDTVIHLAGHSSVGLCEFDSGGAWRNNVQNFKNLVDKLSEKQTLIYASSGSVYGNLNWHATESDATLNSMMVYDMTKIVKDVVALNSISLGKNIVGLRFGTVNGLTPNTRIDLMLNSMIYNAITTGEVNVKNPKIARPILFIEDLKLAILKVLENPISGVYNLASTNITVEEVSKYVVDVTQARVARLPDDSKPYNFHLDSSKFINTYGEYRYSRMERVVDELKNGIQQTNVGRRDILEPRQMRSLWLQ